MLMAIKTLRTFNRPGC